MKNTIIGIVLGFFVAVPAFVFADEIRSGIHTDGFIKLERRTTWEATAQRFVDEDYGVVCWVVNGNRENTMNISCVKK